MGFSPSEVLPRLEPDTSRLACPSFPWVDGCTADPRHEGRWPTLSARSPGSRSHHSARAKTRCPSVAGVPHACGVIQAAVTWLSRSRPHTTHVAARSERTGSRSIGLAPTGSTRRNPHLWRPALTLGAPSHEPQPAPKDRPHPLDRRLSPASEPDGLSPRLAALRYHPKMTSSAVGSCSKRLCSASCRKPGSRPCSRTSRKQTLDSGVGPKAGTTPLRQVIIPCAGPHLSWGFRLFRA